jgi:hypothetical protein
MDNSESQESIMLLRNKVIKTLKNLSQEHEWITTEQVKVFIELKYGESHSLSKVGNNLRVLRECLVVDDKKHRGIRYWKLTGNDYNPDPHVKLLISFPGKMHDKIKSYSKQSRMSKNAFVISMVDRGMKRLPLHRDPVVGALETGPATDLD